MLARASRAGIAPVSVLLAFTFCLSSLLQPGILGGGGMAFAEDEPTGRIEGKITDSDGDPVGLARVLIHSKSTLTNVAVRAGKDGVYLSDVLLAGTYELKVEANGYQIGTAAAVVVKNGENSHADFKLEIINPGPARAESQVDAAKVDVLPFNGRNYQILPWLEPGVQNADGAVLGANKSGTVALSIDSRIGRTTRADLDQTPINDETTGGVITNLPAGGIRELVVTRALPQLYQSLSGAGAVQVVSLSGGDALHGNGFGFFREKAAGNANSPNGLDIPFSRQQYGGALGGAAIKDKLFLFGSGERTSQDSNLPVALNYPFNLLSGGIKAPFKETQFLGRADWHWNADTVAFYRFSYDSVHLVGPSNSYATYLDQLNTPSNVIGVDQSRGNFAHSGRFGYQKFVNHLAPDLGAGIDPAPGLNLVVGSFQSGPNAAGPRSTYQSNLFGRYDGQWRHDAHTLRFGAAVNRISQADAASLGANAPTVDGSTNFNTVGRLVSAATLFPTLVPGDTANGADNPLNYPVTGITIYNGAGAFSEKSGFGLPAGAHNDTRIEAYVGDTWKVLPNLNVSGGVTYVRDTGRTNSDLSAIPCSQINSTRFPTPPCSGSSLLLDQFGNFPSLGASVAQPSNNYAPQIGIAWDPGKHGQTVVRVGAGLFYDTSVFQNAYLDRTSRLATGSYAHSLNLCPTGTALLPSGPVSSVDGLDIGSQICGQPIGTVATAISDLQRQFQSQTSSLTSSSSNPYFLGNTLGGAGLLAPKYKTPVVLDMTAGVQQDLGHGSRLSIDYVRTIETHSPLGIDTNHVGDSNYFDKNAAVAAVNATIAGNPLSSGICPVADSAGSSSQIAVNCYLGAVPNASIADFARHGLDSGNAFCGGFACSGQGLPQAAFGGINPAVGSAIAYFPSGRSVYDGAQFGYRTSGNRPVRGVRHFDLNASYTYSRYKTDVTGPRGGVGDISLLSLAQNYTAPKRYYGFGEFDRTHQFSIAPVLDLPKGLRLSAIVHLASPLPTTLFLPQANGGGVAGEIFRSDFNGDGTVGDILPLQKNGSYGRTVKSGNLNSVINSYNQFSALKFTPASQQLLTSALLNSQQLATLGGLTPLLSNAPVDNAGPRWFKTLDVRLAWPLHVGDRFVVEPSVSVFNVLNFANFDSPGSQLSGVLDGAAGSSVNNTTNSGGCGPTVGICTGRTGRIGAGSGNYASGAPRQMEFGVRITF